MPYGKDHVENARGNENGSDDIAGDARPLVNKNAQIDGQDDQFGQGCRYNVQHWDGDEASPAPVIQLLRRDLRDGVNVVTDAAIFDGNFCDTVSPASRPGAQCIAHGYCRCRDPGRIDTRV